VDLRHLEENLQLAALSGMALWCGGGGGVA